MNNNLWFDSNNKRFIEFTNDDYMSVLIKHCINNSLQSHFNDPLPSPFDYFIDVLKSDWVLLLYTERYLKVVGRAEAIRKNWKHIWKYVDLSKRVLIQEATIDNIPDYDLDVGNEDDIYFYVEESGRSRVFNLPKDRHALKDFILMF